MKRISLLSALVPVLLFASCNKYPTQTIDTPDYYSFVTTEFNGQSLARFVTDDGRSLVPVNEFSANLSDRQRILIYFDLVSELDKDKPDAQIKLFAIDRDVETGTSVKVADAAALKALGDNGTSIVFYPNRPQVTKAYFNIYVGFNAAKPELHTFFLAFDESAANDTKVLELTLCHNDNGDTSSKEWWTWLSFPVDEFADLYAGKETVRINIKTRMNGIQSVELPVPKIDTATDEDDSAELTGYSSGTRLVKE